MCSAVSSAAKRNIWFSRRGLKLDELNYYKWNARMRELGNIAKEEVRDLLGKGWLTHDGMWFYNVCQECGIDRANTLNKAAIKSMSAIEVQRIKEILVIEGKRFETIEEVRDFLLRGMELILPYSVFSKFHVSVTSKDALHWEWENQECFAYKGMKRMGLIGGYECGVIYRIECWFQNLGLTFNSTPKHKKCLMHEKGYCSGDFEFFF